MKPAPDLVNPDNVSAFAIDGGMSLQLLLLGDAPVAQLVARARLAEANGHGAVWVADERFYREVYSCLGQIAAHTAKVLVGPCVTDPYARHPALTAMAIATLDEISGGRAILGIGAGISGFAELGIDRKKPACAVRESIELIRAMLRGETVDCDGEVIAFDHGRLSFSPPRPEVPIYVASNGPLGQRVAAEVADGVIMEACASVAEVCAFRAAVESAARNAGRDAQAIRVVARLNACVAADGRAARDALRPAVARYLGAGRLRSRTAAAQGLVLPTEAVARVAGAAYAAGVAPYLPLVPLVTDRHVDAFTLAGAVDEVTEHAIALRKAGADAIIARPFAPEGGTIEETIVKLGAEVWPRVREGTRALG
jgi:5,10-methylenetetrahydromethanopterin reductase